MEYNLGKVLLTPKGEYNGSTTYEILDVVTYNNSSYVAKQSTTGNAPTEGQTNQYWQLLAKSSGGGGSSTDVRVNGVSITNNDIANILTEGNYDGASNKIATMSEIPMELLVLEEKEDEGTLTQEQITLAQSDHCIIVFGGEYYYKNYLDGSDLEYILNYIYSTDNGICQKLIEINTSDGSYSIEEHSLDIQSDWDESDSTRVAYIKNKPTLTNYVQKSQTAGLLKNDGTVDTNTYLTQHQDISGKEDTSNKVSTISGNETNTTKYPNTKAVADYAQTLANKVTSFQTTPDDIHYPSEKLVKDYVDGICGNIQTILTSI